MVGNYFAEDNANFVSVMAKNYFKSYIWLLETLQSRGHLTLKELQSLWLRSSVNDEEKELAPRTFSNHLQSILDIFGIEIKCDRADNTYYINNEDEIGGSDIKNWMLEALSLNSLLNESAGMKDRIIFESVPSSQKFLTTIIQAIRDKKVLHVVYKSYRKADEEEMILEPYCLREFKKRWYLFAHKGSDDDPHMFALDRIQSVEIGKTKFTLPKKFNAHEFFSGIYGTRVYPDMKAELVTLKVFAMQANYFKSLPLHQSQEIAEETPEYTTFKYFLTPDYDFKQDILSFGATIEVMEPKHLRKELGEIIAELNSKYNG